MNSVPTDSGRPEPHQPGAAPRRGRLNREIRESLRDLGIQLSQLNQSVGARLDMKATDLGCLDLIGRYGPISPSALAGSSAAATRQTAAVSSSTWPAAAARRSSASSSSTRG